MNGTCTYEVSCEKCGNCFNACNTVERGEDVDKLRTQLAAATARADTLEKARREECRKGDEEWKRAQAATARAEAAERERDEARDALREIRTMDNPSQMRIRATREFPGLVTSTGATSWERPAPPPPVSEPPAITREWLDKFAPTAEPVSAPLCECGHLRGTHHVTGCNWGSAGLEGEEYPPCRCPSFRPAPTPRTDQPKGGE